MCPAEDPMASTEPGPESVVLVVEDEVMVRLGISSYLRNHGFKVVEAAGGAEAQTLIEAGLHFDLVFSDINMPAGDGISLALWLEANGFSAPVVLTSALSASLEQARRAGVNASAFINKPYVEERLVERFKALLKK
jgi:two-component system, OmpR family, response regulator